MRLPYTPNPPSFEEAENKSILARVLERRGGKLVPIDRTLLHAPLVADGFNSFIGAIRSKTSVPDDVRELTFCRIAALTGCWYEWNIHAPLALDAGVQKQQLRAVREPILSTTNTLDDRQRAVLAFTDAITHTGHVEDDVFRAVEAYFSENKIMVELVAIITGFIMVTWFCVALQVGESSEIKTLVP